MAPRFSTTAGEAQNGRYPTLRAADLVHARAYADAHRDQIDEEIRENQAAWAHRHLGKVRAGSAERQPLRTRSTASFQPP